MCRSLAEGGRRCHHGNDSELRQQRRVNARLREVYADSVVPNVDAVNATSVGAGVEAAVSRVVKTRDLILNLDSGDVSYGEVTVDGEKFAAVSLARKTLLERLESDVRNLGAAIDDEVASRCGFHASEVGEYAASRKAELEAELDRLRAAEEYLRKGSVARYGLPDFCTFDAVRHKVHDNPDDAEMVALLAEVEDLNKQTEATRNEYYALLSFKDEKLKNMWLSTREAVISVIGEQRKLGGVDLLVDEASDKRKVGLLENVLHVYPADWIEASNANSSSLKVKKTVGRAHYKKDAQDVKVVPVSHFVVKDKDFKPNGSRFESDWVQLQPDKDGMVSYVDKERGINFEQFVLESESVWVKPVYEYASRFSWDDGKPRGRGWVQAEIMEKVDGEMKPVTVWRRESKEKRYVGEFKADLLVDGSKGNLVPSEGYDSAVHEFAHRVEDSRVPLMKELQERFYNRRTTVDGVPMDKVRLYKGRNEFSIPDSFTADYMGKRYEQAEHFEILSTGMEALFGNNYGGLVGMGKFKPDLDMRHFILGMLAGI